MSINVSLNKPIANGYHHRNHAMLVYGGKSYFTLLEQLIANAKKVIYLQFYIFSDDLTGQTIAQFLIDAAHRGVQVYLLVDGYASKGLSHKLISRMTDAGVHFARFNPLLKGDGFYIGRRLHHKAFVVDSCKALVGGINIADKYNSVNGQPPWFDMALYVHGETALELEEICCEFWNICSGSVKVNAREVFQDEVNTLDTVSIKVQRNDWIKGKNQIWKGYADLLANAQNDVIIACSYFLPGWNFRRLMKKAAKRGTTIKVIVAGSSDVAIAKQAERFLYRWMLRNGIRVFEYQKSILHAKVAVVDQKFMTIGSYNINNISAHASIELNLNVRNKAFVTNVTRQLEQLIETDCKEVTKHDYDSSYGRIARLWQEACYGIIKLILYVFTFHVRRERVR